MRLEIPLGTRDYVPVTVSSPDDLTDADVELAFAPAGEGYDTWHPAEWIAGEGNVARIFVTDPGAGIVGAVELAAGDYTVWARITADTQVVLLHAGTLEIFDPSSTAYDRWGMTPARAATLTGVATISARDLDDAEAEIAELLGWAPSPTAYSTDLDDAGAPADRRVWALGRAIAWQAAHRDSTPATPGEQAARISSESIGDGDYAVSYAGGGAVEGGTIAPKARTLLASNGWLSRRYAGQTRP